MLSLIILGIFIIAILVNALIGFLRGFNKAIIRLITLLLVAILSFLIAVPLTDLLCQNIMIQGVSIGELLLSAFTKSETGTVFLDTVPLIKSAILAVPSLLVAMLVLPVVFAIFKFLSWILFLCIQKPVRKYIFKENFSDEVSVSACKIGNRFAGLGIGVVTGVLIFGVFMASIFGFLSVLPSRNACDNLINAMAQQGSMDTETAAVIKSGTELMDSPVVVVYKYTGVTSAGRAYLASASKISADGKTTSLVAEIDSFFTTGQMAIESGLVQALLNKNNPAALYDALSNKETMDAVMQSMFQSKLLRSAAPQLSSAVVKSLAKSIGVPENTVAVYHDMMDDITRTINTANINFAVIQNYEDSQKIQVFALFSTRDGNAIEDNSDYEAEQKKRDALVKKIAKIIEKNTANCDMVLAESIARNIVADVQRKAVEEGNEVVQTLTTKDVQNTIAQILPENLETSEASKSAEEVLVSLVNPEQFKTGVATSETIASAILETVQEAFSDDKKTKQNVDTLSTMVTNIAGAVSDGFDADTGKLNIKDMNFNKVAEAVTALQGSDLNNLGSSVLNVVISSDIANNDLVGNAFAGVKEHYDNGEDISGLIVSTGAIVGVADAMIGSGSNNALEPNDKLAGSFKELVETLDDNTIDLLPTIITEDSIVSLGAPTDLAGEIYDLVDSILREMITIKDSASYDQEVDAVIGIYDRLTDKENPIGKDTLPEIMDDIIASDLMCNVLGNNADILSSALSVENLKKFGLSTVSADHVSEIVDTLIDELKELENQPDHSNEFKGMVSFSAYMTQNCGALDKEDVAELVDYARDYDVVLNALDTLSVDESFVLEIDEGSTRNEIADTLKSHYDSSDKSSREHKIFVALASVLGVEYIIVPT